jgi:hypothetical protein
VAKDGWSRAPEAPREAIKDAVEPEIRLQPKQVQALDLIEGNTASWIGVGGGRGGAKSGGFQRIMLVRRSGLPGTIGAILMRNYDQVKRYHVDPMLRDYPELAPCYHKTESKMVLPMESGPPSEIHFTYAESLDDVIRRFRSANYYDVFVDQAEQFTEAELREIKQCVRSKGAPLGACKLALAFNMGGAGIGFLRSKFNLKEYGPNESESDFAFVHVHPWDNVEWVRAALLEDGLTEDDYYDLFTEEQRMEYCATRGDYGRNLVAQDEALQKRDWLGSWESLEGAFFGRVFDRDAAVIDDEKVALIAKPWHKRWLSQDWGRGHYCPTHWHLSGEMSSADALRILGWQVTKPVKFVLTYREYIAGGAATNDEGGDRELAEQDIAREIVNRTPEGERDTLRSFFLSPDAFAKRSSANTIDYEIGQILKKAGLPQPTQADNDRKGGWGLMYNLCLETKRHAASDEYVWLISANCPELVRSIPLLMRNPKDLDDVIATDKGSAKLEIDVTDSARYGLKSMLSPGKKPKAVLIAEAVAKAHAMATERYVPQQGDVIARYGAPPAASAITPNTAAYLAQKKAEKNLNQGPIKIRRNWRRGPQ